MQKLIVSRDSYGKPRVWIEWKQRANFNEHEYIHNSLGKDGVHPLVYHDALYQLALDQIEPYETIEDMVKDLKIYYEHFKGELIK